MSVLPYELRLTSYVSMSVASPHDHTLHSVRRWFQYATDLDCDLEDWRDVANDDGNWS